VCDDEDSSCVCTPPTIAAAGGCAKVQDTPAKLPWAKKVVQLSASLDGHFAAAVDATGHLYTWGAGECHVCVITCYYRRAGSGAVRGACAVLCVEWGASKCADSK
jgi:hypothetical protein